MKSNTIQSPHDKFFRQFFTDKLRVKDFLKGVLPAEIIDNLKLESLERYPDSFIDEHLKDHFADVLYQCKFGAEEQLEIVFLFEHKSWQPSFPHLQILRYLLEIWEARISSGKPLQPILPIVVYHGQKKWKHKSFMDYFQTDDPEINGFLTPLQPYFPHFDFHLVDLQAIPEKQIQNQFQLPTLKASLLLMKHIRNPDLLKLLPTIMKEVSAVLKEEERKKYFQLISLYLRYTSKEKTEDIIKAMEEIEELSESGAVIGSAAWQDEQRGIKIGMLQGIEKGIEKTAKRLLSKGFSIEETSEYTGLSKEQVAKLRSTRPL